MPWTENVFGDTRFTQWSLVDEYTPMQTDEETSQVEGKHVGDGMSNGVEEQERRKKGPSGHNKLRRM